MNKKIIAIPLSILLTLGLMETASATGTVNFKGNLAGSVCTIDVNNTGRTVAISIWGLLKLILSVL